jgi:hypothetical protein
MLEDLAKTFFQFVETSVQQSEALLIDLARAVDQQVAEVEAVLDQWVEPWLNEEQLQRVDDAVNAAVDATVQPFCQTIYPIVDQYPVCAGCRHYHGQTYGSAFLVCGMYPYGYDGQTCPDWQSTWERETP